MKEQGIEIDKEKLVESTSEEDVENESFSISIIEEFYKPEILKKYIYFCIIFVIASCL